MASNNRDVKMTLSVETLGASEIKNLQDSVAELARQGGDAAPEFERLADEIGRLGQQANALRTFQELASATQELEQRQQQAVQSAEELRTKLAAAAQATQDAASAQRQANTAYDQTKASLTETTGAIAQLRAETDRADKNTAEYRTQMGGLIAEQTRLKLQLEAEDKVRKELNTNLAEAERAQKKLTNEYDRAEKAVANATTKLREQQTILETQRTTTDALGVNTQNLAQAQAQLVASLNASGAAARTAKDGMDALAAADAELTAQADRVRQALQDRIEFTRKAYEADEAVSQRAIAAAAERAAAEKRASDEAIAAKQREQAESDRLYAIQQQGLQQLRGRAAVELEAVTREWREHGDRVEQIEREKAAAVANSSRQAAQAISNAFDTVGARSATELRGEIDRVRAAMNQLRGQAGITGGELQAAMTSGKQRIKELERELRAATNQLTLADKAADLFANSMGQIAAGNLIADGIGSIIEQIKGMGREFVEANLRMERLTRTMTVITGSAEGAAEKIRFLRETANTAGVSIGAVTDSFIRFQASASASGIAAEEVDSIFKAVTVSGSRMGMTSDRVALALDALGQIASKNTVSMEELRQQLGDSLPGAFAITAKGLDITTEKLVKMVENGELVAGEFFPAFKRGLEETFGDSDKQVEGLFQAFQRLRNAFEELYQQAAGSSAFTALAQAFDFLAKNLATVADVTYGLGKAFLALKVIDMIRDMRIFGQTSKAVAADIGVQTAAVGANTAATTANTTATNLNTAAKRANAAAWTSLAEQLGQVGPRMQSVQTGAGLATGALGAMSTAARGLLSIVGGLPGVFVAVALNARELGTWIGEGIAKWQGYGKAIEDAERAMKAQEQASKDRAEQLRLESEELTKRIRAEAAALTERRTQAEADATVAEKQIETAKEQAALSERIARLYGDETIALQASTEAAQANLTAVQNESAVKNELVTALEAEIAKKTELINSSTNVSEKMREELVELQNLLAKKKEEAAQAAVSVQNARLEVAERKLAAESYRDNAASLDQYKTAVEAARTNLAELIEMEKQGLPVSDAVVAARIELAKSTGLYKDAAKDATEAIRLETQEKTNSIETKQAVIQVALEEAKAAYEVAKANGNETQASYELGQMKKLERELNLLNLEVKRAEAEASIAVARAKIQEIQASGELTPAKRAEINALQASITAKEAEVKIIDITTQKMKALALTNHEVGSSASGTVGKFDEQAEAIRRVGESAEEARARLAALADENERINLIEADRSSWMHDADGNLTGPGLKGTPTSGGGSFDATWVKLVEKNPFRGNSLSQYTRWLEGMQKAYQAAIERERRKGESSSSAPAEKPGGGSFTIDENGMVKKPIPSVGAPPTAGSKPSGAPDAGKTYTVNVNLNGRTTAINTSSPADAQALVGMLKTLESSAMRSA